mmetsp:Transcript_27310/g.44862  ORF Transcript_27310/g.44862 Transcript_27310/m.44862 type:complete len:283 (+) Transcript_27310:285-1133(+)
MLSDFHLDLDLSAVRRRHIAHLRAMLNLVVHIVIVRLHHHRDVAATCMRVRQAEKVSHQQARRNRKTADHNMLVIKMQQILNERNGGAQKSTKTVTCALKVDARRMKEGGVTKRSHLAHTAGGTNNQHTEQHQQTLSVHQTLVGNTRRFVHKRVQQNETDRVQSRRQQDTHMIRQRFRPIISEYAQCHLRYIQEQKNKRREFSSTQCFVGNHINKRLQRQRTNAHEKKRKAMAIYHHFRPCLFVDGGIILFFFHRKCRRGFATFASRCGSNRFVGEQILLQT